MTFQEYQDQSATTAQYPARVLPTLAYLGLGFTGEAGEVANKIKKIFRDKEGVVGELEREQLLLECGDTLWYLTQLAKELGSSLEEVAEKNVSKLKDRKEREVIRGEGDGR